MQVKNLVQICNGELRSGTWLISLGFERDHPMTLKIIKKYQEDFENFSTLKVNKLKSTGGRPVEEYLLTEPQTVFLGTLFRNNERVVKFKAALVKEFFRMKEVLVRLKEQSKDPRWITARTEGKDVRLYATNAMKEFIEYAKEQGGTPAGCDRYYSNISTMANTALFIIQGKFKNLRDVMTPRQLMIISAAEGIIDRALNDGMKKDTHYKAIYKQVRANVEMFAELHGQSEILNKQLALFE